MNRPKTTEDTEEGAFSTSIRTSYQDMHTGLHLQPTENTTTGLQQDKRYLSSTFQLNHSHKVKICNTKSGLSFNARDLI